MKYINVDKLLRNVNATKETMYNLSNEKDTPAYSELIGLVFELLEVALLKALEEEDESTVQSDV